jgi:hypothetical protein
MNKICQIEFQFCESLKSISPSPSIKIIRGFNHCHRRSEVVLSSGSCLDEIDGFMECKSLSWIEIIKSKLFQNCAKLHKFDWNQIFGRFTYERDSWICSLRITWSNWDCCIDWNDPYVRILSI